MPLKFIKVQANKYLSIPSFSLMPSALHLYHKMPILVGQAANTCPGTSDETSSKKQQQTCSRNQQV